MQRLGPVNVGDTVEAQFQMDLRREHQTVEALAEAVAHCTSVGEFRHPENA
jgi:bacterioferritin (cytochrome b1)